MKLVLPDKNYRYRHPSQLPALFRNENGAIDLASVMVGIIVIGLVGGIIAATIFAVIPWAQDAAAKHQLDSITQAENAYYGFTAGNLSNLPSGAKANTYSSSPMIAESNLLQQGANYCVVASADGKSYNSYSLSGTGRVWTTTNVNVPPSIYNGSFADACPAAYTNPNSGQSGPAPTATVNWPGEFNGTQSVGLNQTGTKNLSFSLPNTYGSYTVTWTDTLSNMNGSGSAVNTSTLTDSNGLPYWQYTITPGTGGWSAGTATVTATITDNTTKQTSTKTWNIIIPSGASGSNDPMWHTGEAPTMQFVGFSHDPNHSDWVDVTLATDGKANNFAYGGSFVEMTYVALYCTPAGGGSISGPWYGTAATTLSSPWGITNHGYNTSTVHGSTCPLGQVPYAASASVPPEWVWEQQYSSNWNFGGLLTPVPLTTNIK